MNHLIAGGAGFIGQNLTRYLLKDNSSKVLIMDNHSNSHLESFKILKSEFKKTGRMLSLTVDIAKYTALNKGIDKAADAFLDINDENCVWHLAANSDIPSGISDPAIDLKDTFLTTYNLLRLCENRCIKKFVFASSSAIYGNQGETAIVESTGPLMPISNYGAMKLASEAMCFAAHHNFLDNMRVFRFPNVVGTPATHGVIYDFVSRLKQNPTTLSVLGDGTQKKSYLHVTDLIKAMVYLSGVTLKEGDNCIFNLGPSQDSVTVREIAECVVQHVSPNATIGYGNTDYGWRGDVPRFCYNIEKASSYGWSPTLNSKSAIELAVQEIAASIQ